MNPDINTGGPACSVCGAQAVRFQGHQHLCAKHYRFGQMRSGAKRHGKSVPSRVELDLLAALGAGCADCGVEMNWLAVNGQSTVATLQHYRDGTFGIVCRSCNTRHAFMPGDSYRDMPKDHRLCNGCATIKPLTSFGLDASRSGPMKVKSKCRSCSAAAFKQWKEKNRGQYNEYQRDYRAKRKAAGNSTHGSA